MKNLPSLLHQAVLAVAGALALGACSRGHYAVLPKAPAYLGAAPIAATAPRAVAQPQPAPVAAPDVAATPPAAASATPAKPAAPVAKFAGAPVASATPAVAPEAAATVAPAKPSLAQRIVLKKLTRKLDKLATQTPQLRQHDAAAGTSRADGGLRQALVVGVIGLAIILLGALLNIGIIYVVGVIVLVVALVLLLLYLINQM